VIISEKGYVITPKNIASELTLTENNEFLYD